MNRNERTYFRDTLRDSRAVALQDAEGFGAVLFALERLGQYLLGNRANLAKYRSKIVELAARSALAEIIPNAWRECHTPFGDLYDQLRHARNGALHEGAFARHLTSHTVNIALVLEDALMDDLDRISDYMVRMPACACMWQPLSFIRQTLLAKSFSSLPVNAGTDDDPEWRLISDLALAAFLRNAPGAERNRRLGLSLQDAIASGLELSAPLLCPPDTPLRKALAGCGGLPILIVSESSKQLLGIATSFDLL